MVLFVDLIKIIFGFENSLFSYRRIKELFRLGITKCQDKINFQQLFIGQEKCHTSVESRKVKHELRVTSSNPRVRILKARVRRKIRS